MRSIHSTVLPVKLMELKDFLILERVGGYYGYGRSIQVKANV